MMVDLESHESKDGGCLRNRTVLFFEGSSESCKANRFWGTRRQIGRFYLRERSECDDLGWIILQNRFG